MTSQMWYNIPVTQSGTGRFLLSSADGGSIAYRYWVKHPVLLDLRPADCVTTSASSTGCFAMTAKNGEPCKKCGTREWRSNGDCVQCGRNRALKRYHDDPERSKRLRQEWSENNREYERERNRTRGYSQRYKRNNKDKVRESDRRWTQNNKDKVNAKTHRYRAAKNNAGGSYTVEEWEALCKQYDYCCLCCGKRTKLTADHIVPVSWGGSSDISNIQPLCKSCNTAKRDRHATDYRSKPGIMRWIQKKLFGE